MTLQDFENQYNGQKVVSAHGIVGQCVSVSSLWCEKNGWPSLMGPTAYSIYLNFRAPAYEVIANSPSNYPQPGDVVFWDSRFGGGAGHTGVVVSADANSLTVFQQNDPYGTGAHTKTYNYFAVAGWFHPVALGQIGAGVVGVNRQVTITTTVNVRTAPTTSAPLAINPTIPHGQLAPNTTITVTGYEHAQNVNGNDVWLRTVRNDWIWSGATTVTNW